MIRALIFDFDGLIMDTEGPVYQAWVEIYQELGADLPLSAWEVWVGGSPDGFDPCGYLETQLGRPVDREALTERASKREEELILAESALPGVEEYIADARRMGLKLGVASSSDCPWVYRHLERLGLRDQFDSIKCAEDVENVKPSPDLYLAVLDELGVGPEEAIALEDSPHGITAAQAAGLICVVVPNPLTSQMPTDHADLELDSLADMPLEGLLSRVGRSTR
ncbi:MAG TPA: HAD family hydrolase [Anaerolineae bacterium]|nr:HAD family hydrolase [Anaerolineae bacterium]